MPTNSWIVEILLLPKYCTNEYPGGYLIFSLQYRQNSQTRIFWKGSQERLDLKYWRVRASFRKVLITNGYSWNNYKFTLKQLWNGGKAVNFVEPWEEIFFNNQMFLPRKHKRKAHKTIEDD